MKIAPLYHALTQRAWCKPVLVHSGQHYDLGMSDVFFRDLNLPVPDHALGIGGGSHGEQLGKVVMAYEKLLAGTRPDLVTVVGDVNATAACTLAAKKLNLPVAHVEAGLRSRDRTMPEEINRIVTDQLADLLFTPSTDADENLAAEGIARERVRFVGNVMIDTVVRLLPHARKKAPIVTLDRFALVTLHRPANVDDVRKLVALLEVLAEISRDLPVVFPIHPRTQESVRRAGFVFPDTMVVLEPLGYLDFLALEERAAIVVTDSGGVQEETTFLGVPCLTMRANTERPVTVTIGTNVLIGGDPELLREAIRRPPKRGSIPPSWDGRAAERIADELLRR
jgi:UDP-N-acetylglucosamine 2-epimerase (non-hydrolysing)